jgi:hypothetical protein
MSKERPWSAVRKYNQQNGVCQRQKELNKATEIRSGGSWRESWPL